MFTSTVAEAGGFIKSNNEKNIPDIQLHFAPAMVIDHGRTSVWGHGRVPKLMFFRGQLPLRAQNVIECLEYFFHYLI